MVLLYFLVVIMYDYDSLTDVLNNLIDMSSDMMRLPAEEGVDDITFILAALVDDMIVRGASAEIDWVLTSLRDTNLESTSCLVLAALLLTKEHTSAKREILNSWYLEWINQNRSELAALYLAQLLAPEEQAHEHHTTSTSGRPASSNEGN